MELSKPKLISWLGGALMVGIWVGIGLFFYTIRNSPGDAIALHDSDQLRMSVLVLKLLDENKIDVAKKVLEGNIKVVLDLKPKGLDLPMSESIRTMYQQEIKFAEMATTDRSKTYLQLAEERKKLFGESNCADEKDAQEKPRASHCGR